MNLRVINEEGVLSGLLLTIIQIKTDDNQVVEEIVSNPHIPQTALYDLIFDLRQLFKCEVFPYYNKAIFNSILYYDEGRFFINK